MMPLPDSGLPWPIPMEAVALIAEAEGLRLKAYRCPAGVPTIGWSSRSSTRPCSQSKKRAGSQVGSGMPGKTGVAWLLQRSVGCR